MNSFFIVAGLLLIVLALGRFVRKRAEDKAMTEEPGDKTMPDTMAPDGSNGQSLKRQQVEDISRHLDNRMSAVRALIGEADERIERLEKLINRAEALAPDRKMKQDGQDEK